MYSQFFLENQTGEAYNQPLTTILGNGCIVRHLGVISRISRMKELPDILLKGFQMENEAISYSQVQEMVMKLPAIKLPVAYRLLADLQSGNTDLDSPQQDLMLLPLAERRSVMRQQAEEWVAHYRQKESERQEWQTGEFVEY